MHNLIHKYLDGIDSLKEDVDKNSEKILKRIDLERLLQDPRKYLKVISKAFYESHSNQLLSAIDIGRDHAKEIIKRS